MHIKIINIISASLSAMFEKFDAKLFDAKRLIFASRMFEAAPFEKFDAALFDAMRSTLRV